jgi:hypothetical protein
MVVAERLKAGEHLVDLGLLADEGGECGFLVPARYIFLDEVDAYPASADEEGDPVTLAEARSLTFAHRRKVFLVSTPTIRGLSRIEREYEVSDQRRFFVPCPHCGVMQWLKFDRLRWQKGKPETAEYHCEGCDAAIAEHHKTAMLEGGEWRATAAAADPTTVGYHLSALYSPIGWLSWERIVRAWDAAQGSDEAIKAFRNTILGETWVETGEAPDWQRLYDRRERWTSGTVPAGGLFLTAGRTFSKPVSFERKLSLNIAVSRASSYASSMSYPEPPSNKSAVRKAGQAISNGTASQDNFQLVDQWRASHGYVINTFQAWLKGHINKQDFYIEFAQRLKRRNTVIDKLQRKDRNGKPLISDVAGMHDFAGCRMIFDDVAQMVVFRKYLHSSAVMKNVEHVLRHDPEKYNYIEHPKFTGYRGIHDVYKHFPRGQGNRVWKTL